MVDEFLDLPATLSDEPDHDHVGLGVPRHHAEQHTLADTRPGKQAEALAAAD